MGEAMIAGGVSSQTSSRHAFGAGVLREVHRNSPFMAMQRLLRRLEQHSL